MEISVLTLWGTINSSLKKQVLAWFFYPPYSPDLNPIELAWNKMKIYRRKKRAKTTDELYKAYAEALKLVTVEDSKRFITHSMKFLK